MATQTKPTAKELKPPITVQQWGELEGPPHYDLVNGHLQEIPDVAFWHEVLFQALSSYLWLFVHQHKRGLIVGSRAKLEISALSGREPDIFFIPVSQLHLVGKNLFTGIPALVVEILSPTNESTDRIAKAREYAALGIDQYWIVDFANRTIEIYVLAPPVNGGRVYELAETVSGDVIFRPSLVPGIEIPLAEVWPTEFEDRTDSKA